MNIFQVLSQGKSRLHEPSMSAMLGYLLDSNKDHGLGDTFVRVFLEHLETETLNELLLADFINSQVSLEEPYQLDGARKDIDVQVTILDEKNNEVLRVIIENKIKVGAANPKQLKDYYSAVVSEEPDLRLFFIFLTPDRKSSSLEAEYNNLKLENPEKHYKKWIFWESSPNKGILDLVRSVLAKEMSGEINPINEYMRHTLKAFIRHVMEVTQPQSRKTMRTGQDIGEIIDEATIKTKNGKCYRVVRRDSTQIQVFNQLTGDKEIARRILSKFIDENGLGIPHTKLNTRGIGKQFFEWFHKNNT